MGCDRSSACGVSFVFDLSKGQDFSLLLETTEKVILEINK